MHFHTNQIKKVFISSYVPCIKSKRQRFYVLSADTHIFLHNLCRHVLIMRASLFCSASGNNHVRKVVSRECPYYSWCSWVHAHIFSLFIHHISPFLSLSLSLSRAHSLLFLQFFSNRCDAMRSTTLSSDIRCNFDNFREKIITAKIFANNVIWYLSII